MNYETSKCDHCCLLIPQVSNMSLSRRGICKILKVLKVVLPCLSCLGLAIHIERHALGGPDAMPYVSIHPAFCGSNTASWIQVESLAMCHCGSTTPTKNELLSDGIRCDKITCVHGKLHVSTALLILVASKSVLVLYTYTSYIYIYIRYVYIYIYIHTYTLYIYTYDIYIYTRYIYIHLIYINRWSFLFFSNPHVFLRPGWDQPCHFPVSRDSLFCEKLRLREFPINHKRASCLI